SPTHEQARELLAYWQERMGKGGFVMGRDIPSRQIAHLMKHLIVREPVEGGRDFRNRLVGTVLMERLGRDVTGLLISDVYAPASAPAFIAALRKVIDTGKPVFLRAEVHGMVDTVRTAEGVLLPMKAPDGAANWTLNGVFYL
ncbi:MAG: PAS domain-containing protein, partial [Rhizomicrobium sp.]